MSEKIYPIVKDCKFLKPQAEINCPLPDFINLERKSGGGYLAFTYNFKAYILGISPDGWLCGFRGALREGKKAELIILKSDGGGTQSGGYKVYDARSTPDGAVERELFSEPVEDPTLKYLHQFRQQAAPSAQRSPFVLPATYY